MVSSDSWVLLSYRVPREPSTPRIAVWRQLKRLGAAQIGDGLVGLPYDAATKESLEWVAHSVLEAGGNATTWVATPSARRFGAELAAGMAEERAAEYADLRLRIEEFEGGRAEGRRIQAIRDEFRRIERRDYFPPPERAETQAALRQLEARLREAEAT